MWNRIIDFLSKDILINPNYKDSRDDAKNRLKLVLMHDRTQLPPGTMEKMREELVEVISKYVKIDKESLELNFEKDTNTIALVANIPVFGAKEDVKETPKETSTKATTKPVTKEVAKDNAKEATKETVKESTKDSTTA